MRAVVERCQHTGPKAHTLVTLGGQHQGVMNVPSCWNPSLNMTPSYVCSASARFLGWGATLPFIRTRLVQAQYFKVLPCCQARPPQLTPTHCDHLCICSGEA